MTSTTKPFETTLPTSAPGSSATTTTAFASDGIDGRLWTTDTYLTDLGIESGLSLQNQAARPLDGVLLGLHKLVDASSVHDMVWGGRHLLLFSDADPRDSPPIQWTVSGTVDLLLADDEQLSLAHIGCGVDGIYDETVFAVITPPLVEGVADVAADKWPARRAWRYATSGPPVEFDPSGVTCELAGE